MVNSTDKFRDFNDPASSTDWDNDGCKDDSFEDTDDDNDGVLDVDDACPRRVIRHLVQHGFPIQPQTLMDGCRDSDEDSDDDNDGFEDD